MVVEHCLHSSLIIFYSVCLSKAWWCLWMGTIPSPVPRGILFFGALGQNASGGTERTMLTEAYEGNALTSALRLTAHGWNDAERVWRHFQLCQFEALILTQSFYSESFAVLWASAQSWGREQKKLVVHIFLLHTEPSMIRSFLFPLLQFHLFRIPSPFFCKIQNNVKLSLSYRME